MRLKTTNPYTVETASSKMDVLQRLYRQEIEDVLNELEILVRRWHDQACTPLVTYAKDHFRLLRACYLSSTLPTQALDVLLQNLRALAPILSRDMNEALESTR